MVAVTPDGTAERILPILGSGGKIAFDVDLQGSLVGYKSLLRNIGTRVGTQPIVALLSPKDAEARATQQFAARGMDPSRFTIARREFGYWLHGRSIEQKYLAPHFVFGFVSKDGNAPSVGEKVLAVTDPNLLKLLAEDEALEQKSVARLSRFASTPTERRSARN